MTGTELAVSKVVVHPLVLLSVVDHFNRMGKIGHHDRVVGILLGSWKEKGVLDVSNSFAVPFDEDEKDKSVWFLDHDYLENMYSMFKKVNARERIVGWYHTGPNLHPSDIPINELVRRYCSTSVLVIIDAQLLSIGLPTEAYIAVEEVHDDGTPTTKTFEHVPSEIGAEEAEEVGVEHLLRDIKDTTLGTLSQRITNQLMGLKGLQGQVHHIRNYLEQASSPGRAGAVHRAGQNALAIRAWEAAQKRRGHKIVVSRSLLLRVLSFAVQVVLGNLPVNHTIIYQLQDIFNLLPDIGLQEFVKSLYVKTNDQMLVVYLASLVRSVVALHNLINNKITNRDAEKKESAKKDEPKEKKPEEKKKEVKT
ncbi:hypothetical protein HPB48_002172 [Haemaphysalis longicornis]|uniref:26S proteasome non-ATPase regulatory subunit 7 n=1 Tax=Haemaphysalis longicornis TaxID=44386 RepID=A0A9J6FGH7_HAELO|nr:hypothetical protein HPB48_002172 [Haemaphysalis longicornis]